MASVIAVSHNSYPCISYKASSADKSPTSPNNLRDELETAVPSLINTLEWESDTAYRECDLGMARSRTVNKLVLLNRRAIIGKIAAFCDTVSNHSMFFSMFRILPKNSFKKFSIQRGIYWIENHAISFLLFWRGILRISK